MVFPICDTSSQPIKGETHGDACMEPTTMKGISLRGLRELWNKIQHFFEERAGEDPLDINTITTDQVVKEFVKVRKKKDILPRL